MRKAEIDGGRELLFVHLMQVTDVHALLLVSSHDGFVQLLAPRDGRAGGIFGQFGIDQAFGNALPACGAGGGVIPIDT